MRALFCLVLWLCLTGISLGGDVLLAFTASWCGPCKQFKQDLAAHPDWLAAYEVDVVDVDALPDMKRDFGVTSYPTFIVVKVGEDGVLRKENTAARKSGYHGMKNLTRWLERQER